MRPGIIVQHGRLPARTRELVRCDVTALIGFIPVPLPTPMEPLRRRSDLAPVADRLEADESAEAQLLGADSAAVEAAATAGAPGTEAERALLEQWVMLHRRARSIREQVTAARDAGRLDQPLPLADGARLNRGLSYLYAERALLGEARGLMASARERGMDLDRAPRSVAEEELSERVESLRERLADLHDIRQGVGRFVEVVLRREGDIWVLRDQEPIEELRQPASRTMMREAVAAFLQRMRRPVHQFFLNGGRVLHLFGVMVGSVDELHTPQAVVEALGEPGLRLEPESERDRGGMLLSRLRNDEDIALVTVPDAAGMYWTMSSRTGAVMADVEPLYEALLAHCREMHNRFLILDPPRGLHGELLERWVQSFRARNELNRSHGALYYPWLFEGGEAFPPSATMAGVYAGTEIEHGDYGVAWPPANVPLLGVTHPEVELDWSEASAMAERSINPLVLQAGRGVVVSGARTLSRQRGYVYVNSRRVVGMITEQLRRDSEWAVFETNNPHLWDVLDRDIRYRLEEFWRGGLLSGDAAGEEYAVLCDHSNNPRETLDAGQVNVAVQLRPVGTTEQILIDLQLGS